MSEVVKILRGEVTALFKNSDKIFDEYAVEKDGTRIGSRFIFSVQTRVNDRVNNSPRLFRRCNYFVKTSEEIEKVKNTLKLGAVLDIDGNSNRYSFKDKKTNESVWRDEVSVHGITIIQSSSNGEQTTLTGNDDLPF